jgi:hypothetical protein
VVVSWRLACGRSRPPQDAHGLLRAPTITASPHATHTHTHTHTHTRARTHHGSYLPLAHIYERNNLTGAIHLGGSVGFYSGNVQELLDDVLVRSRAGA